MKKLASLLLAVLLLCTMMSVATVPAFAEETPETVSQTTEENETLIKTAEELQTYINSLPSGAVATVNLAETITVDHEIVINKPCTLTFKQITTFYLPNRLRAFYIDCNNVKLSFADKCTFDGKGMTQYLDGRVIYIEGDNCTIEGPTFLNCRNDDSLRTEKMSEGFYGAAICVDGNNCNIRKCCFTNCKTSNNGGAIFIDENKNTVTDCIFTDCSSKGDGGAIGTGLSAVENKIERCSFKYCMAFEYKTADGGAISVRGENNTINDCDFECCYAKTGGGAIYLKHDDSTITNCNFKNCRATESDGGAVYLGVDVDDITIRDCNFEECTAESGGAIYSNTSSFRTEITNCTFNQCQAKEVDGGAISIGFDCDDVTITNSTFTSCTAEHDGGAINICQQSDDIRIESTKFDNCHALTGRGGAVFLGFGAARCNIVTCDFSNCSADDDGDYVLGDGDTVIKNCTPKTEDEKLFYDCEFDFSVATSTEASCNNWSDVKNAISNGGDTVTIILNKNVTVTETITINRTCTVIFKGQDATQAYKIGNAHLRAFVIGADGVTLKFDDNIIISNCKPDVDEGGAIYVSGYNCTIQGGVFEDCEAEYGGAIYANQDVCTIKKAVFRNNHAVEDGGAIYVNDDAVIERCMFLNNSAGEDGGSIYDGNGYGDVYIKDCTFEGGSCGGDGDGIWVYCNGDAILENCTPGGEEYYDDPEESDGSLTGSALSEGNLWIVIGVAVVAIAGVAALVIAKKKKKPALADGAEKDDEE